ncbi:unnamed protein product [Oikopleura dioica]|uniref:Uncharacterized protein n=1 Tax=Oikopleura dioica TaxID=34765 RepID=E4X2H8_OIKDI|nr:unnamed protein product [Oikopleura dioica]
MPLPGYYTSVAKLTNKLGEPFYEWKWAVKMTTGNQEQDIFMRKTPAENVFPSLGWEIPRVGRSPFKVTKPVNYDQARYKMIPHQHPWIFRNFKVRDSSTDVRFLPSAYLVKYKERSTVEGLTSVNYKNLRTERGRLFTHLDIELRKLVVESLQTEFSSSGSNKLLIDTTKKDCSYVKLENTRICEDCGHVSVLKYLRKQLLSFDDAQKKCDELGYLCTGFSEDTPGKYRLREFTKLLSSDNTPKNCNTKGDHTYHKSCPGDQSFIQISEDLTIPIASQLTPPNYAFTHRLQD